MALANRIQIAPTKADVPHRDMSIILGFSVLAVVMLIALYLAGGEPGTAPGDLANMAVFP
jgi:hypothetical protein